MAAKAAEPDPQPYTGPIRFTILGQPASKSNRRQIVEIAGKSQLIKSKEALAYEKNALLQIPPRARLRLVCPVRLTLHIFYETNQSDLDESVVMDVLQNQYTRVKVPGQEKKVKTLVQAGVYVNDRQVKEKHVYHGIDKLNPRTEVLIESLSPQLEIA
jgi:Holliday junction resolvase RusA-like endonuclease